MRLAQNGGLEDQGDAGRRGKKQREKKLDADCIVLNGDTEGSSRSCRSSNRGYLNRELADGNEFGVYGLWWTRLHTEVGCLTAGRAAVVDELGMFLDGHVGGDAGCIKSAGAVHR